MLASNSPTRTNQACSIQKQKGDKKALKTHQEFIIYNTIKPIALKSLVEKKKKKKQYLQMTKSNMHLGTSRTPIQNIETLVF